MSNASHASTRFWTRSRVIAASLATVVATTAIAVNAAPARAGIPYLDIPEPTRLARIATEDPSAQGRLFPSRPVLNDGSSTDLPSSDKTLPETVPWKGGQIPVEEMLDITDSRAFIVLNQGQLVSEWYAEDVDPDTRLSSWSVAKSVVSLMIGQAIDRGLLSEEDLMVDILPEFRVDEAAGGDPAYNRITVGDLLDMASGIDVSENYNPLWPFTGTARMLLSTDLPEFLRDHRSTYFEPGSRAEYRSVDTQMLSMILTRVNDGKPVAQIASEDIWTPMGAEFDANWNLDREDGIEKGFCCINAAPRDFARIGQMVLDGGLVGGNQVIPEAWIDRISTPSGMDIDDWGYSAQFWFPPTSTGDFNALGVYGQYIWIDPNTDTVVVKLSDHGTEQDEVETIEAMRAIAAHLSAR